MRRQWTYCPVVGSEVEVLVSPAAGDWRACNKLSAWVWVQGEESRA